MTIAKLDAAIPRVLKPSEVALMRAKKMQLIKKLERQRRRQQLLVSTEGAPALSAEADHAAEAQLATLRAECAELDDSAVAFSTADMTRTPLPKITTREILELRYACEQDDRLDLGLVKVAGEQIRLNAVEVRILLWVLETWA